jgi:hypothetical protein
LSNVLLEYLEPAGKILLFGVGPLSTETIQSRGCISIGQLVSPSQDEIEKLPRAGVSAIVVQDLGRSSSPSSLLKQLSDKFPEAQLLIWFWNASSSNMIISQLVDRPEGRFVLAETQVKAWLSELGLSIHSREAIRASVLNLLAREAQEGLQALFDQLNPDSRDDLIVYKVGRARASSAETDRLIPGLLSIVLWVEQGSRLLDECVFAITGQNYRPLELIAVTRETEADVLRGMLEQYSRIEPFGYQVLVVEKLQRAEALNRAIELARGRYLGFLSADQVVFPEHYVRLIQKLAEGDAGWAMSGFIRAYLDDGAGGAPFIQWKRECAPRYPFDLSFFQYNRPIGCSLVIDRSRLGRFPLTFSSSEGPLQNDPLLIKLAALFRPAVVQGPPSCEQRMNSGDATIEDSPEAPPIQALVPLPEVTKAVASRLRMLVLIDRGKTQLRLRLPRFYRIAKQLSNWVSKLLSGKSLRENVDRFSRGGQ